MHSIVRHHRLPASPFGLSLYHSLSLLTMVALLLTLVGPDEATAQRRKSVFGDKKAKAEKTADPGSKKAAKRGMANGTPAQGRKDEKDREKFAPTNVLLDVKGESIQLAATWFPPIIEDEKKKKNEKQPNAPGTGETKELEQGKETAPFILVHDWGRNRRDLFQMALFLQANGHAVIVPDLRGHGESVNVMGSKKALDHKKFRKADKASAVGDIDQCKRFLQEKNNEGLVNIDLLNVVAVGDSAHLAIAWAITDWSWNPVAGIKQGKDVKSLILFSPTKTFAGSALKKLTKDPLVSGRNTAPLPMLIVWGKQSGAAEICDDFVQQLRKTRPEVSEGDMATRWRNQNLFHFEATTSMEGYELAGNPQASQIWSFANDFVSQKVLAFKDQCPWQIRGAEAVLKARAEQED